MATYRVHMLIQYVEATSKLDAKSKVFTRIFDDDSLLLAELASPDEPTDDDR